MANDFRIKLDQARQRLPLTRLMEQRGKGPANGNWKKFPACPYCGKDGSGLYGEPPRFKCWHRSCPSGTHEPKASWDEIGFLQHELQLSRKEASKVYLKESGVWQEQERLAPSVMPGKAGRKRRLEEEPSSPPPPPESEAEPEEGVRFEELSPGEVTPRPTGESPPSEIHAEPGSEPDGPTGGGGDLPKEKEQENAGGPPKLPGDDEDLGAPGPLRALRWFYRRLHWSAKDGAAIWAKRGLTPATCAALGLRSNPKPMPGRPGNQAILQSMAAVFPPAVLVDCGLWVEAKTPGKPPKPNAQFYGMSVVEKRDPRTHKKVRDTAGKPVVEMVWNEPVIIPYFNSAGELVHLRPHKGMMKGRSPRLYVARAGGRAPGPSRSGHPYPPGERFAVITEGEFKADALWQALAPGNATNVTLEVGAIPGITMARLLLADIEEWLEETGVRKVVVAYDRQETGDEHELQEKGDEHDHRQEKGDEPLPGYQAEDWKRHAAQVWARLLARLLQKEGYEALVAVLPKDWEDRDGKADWDGWLAARLKALGVTGKESVEGSVPPAPAEPRAEPAQVEPVPVPEPVKVEAELPGVDSKIVNLKGEPVASVTVPPREGTEPPPPREGTRPTAADLVWGKFAGVIGKEMLAVLQGARPVGELWQAGFFDSREERLIQNGLERISYEPKLPVGGARELATARRLQRLVVRLKGQDRRLGPKERGFLMMLGKAYLDLKGGYYVLKKLKDATLERWVALAQKAREGDDAEVARAADVALRGIPERVSDFYMKAHYVLKRPNGTRVRLVSLHNIHGVSSNLLNLPSAPFAQPSKYREWLLDSITGATWRAGERELNDLQADIARDVAWKDVTEITVRGYHAESGCWFFKGRAITPEGREVVPDRSGIFWIERNSGSSQPGQESASQIKEAYQLAEKDHEGQEFSHKEPEMNWTARRGGPKIELGALTEEYVRTLFQELTRRLYETVGGYDAHMALGTVLSFAALPEIYAAFAGVPGLWIHGETQHGKTSVARWLMQICGFFIDGGIPLMGSSGPGVSIALQQYGYLPVFLEEYQPNPEGWLVEKLKNVYDRIAGIKKTFKEEGSRRILAFALVTGVATSTDAQLRSRFAHVQVSKERRMVDPSTGQQFNHYDWFQEECKRFWVIGRHLLKQRKEFSKMVMESLRAWMRNPKLAGVTERARLVHGTAYASFAAASVLMQSHGPEELRKYQSWLLEHCQGAASQVQEQVNVNQFWRDLLNALTSDAFGFSPADLQKIFLLAKAKKGTSPVTAQQLKWGEEHSLYRWESYWLYFRPGPVIEMMRQHKRKQGRDLPLDQRDLRSQMQSRKYWVPATDLRGRAIDCHRQRFRGLNSPSSCWCIALDWHELGRLDVSDEEFEAALYKNSDKDPGIHLAMDEWVDPRRGDLFALVDAISKKAEA